MRLVLKALGLTIWGFIAIGLLAIFMFFGYGTAECAGSSIDPGILPEQQLTQGIENPGIRPQAL